jgi:hypothetical protein
MREGNNAKEQNLEASDRIDGPDAPGHAIPGVRAVGGQRRYDRKQTVDYRV